MFAAVQLVATTLNRVALDYSNLLPFHKRKKDAVWRPFSFMERVTRLELATSTLARWRSTG